MIGSVTVGSITLFNGGGFRSTFALSFVVSVLSPRIAKNNTKESKSRSQSLHGLSTWAAFPRAADAALAGDDGGGMQ